MIVHIKSQDVIAILDVDFMDKELPEIGSVFVSPGGAVFTRLY